MFKDGDIICFFGDSITANGLTVAEIYQTVGKKKRIKCFNCGVSGGDARNASEYIYSHCLIRNPTYVVVNFGINDMRLSLYYDSCDLADKEEQGNAWGNWDPEKFTVEDSAFGFIKMKNGAVINLESSWALNIADYHEASYMICGDLGGADTINDQARLNYIKHQRQCIEIPDLDAGGAAFFAAKSDGSPAEIEAANWINAILTDTDPVVLPRQALVVTRILEAIYESAKTGKPVYFD